MISCISGIIIGMIRETFTHRGNKRSSYDYHKTRVSHCISIHYGHPMLETVKGSTKRAPSEKPAEGRIAFHVVGKSIKSICVHPTLHFTESQTNLAIDGKFP